MMKKLLSRVALLSYTDFSKPFDVYTDAVLSLVKNRGPLPSQTRYTTTEHELLARVETLKEFRNILLGHHIRVYTDHENLTCKF
jgi:RNase H-like domain found in reverse transcriptase